MFFALVGLRGSLPFLGTTLRSPWNNNCLPFRGEAQSPAGVPKIGI